MRVWKPSDGTSLNSFCILLFIMPSSLPGFRKAHRTPDCPFKEAVPVRETFTIILVLIYNLMKNTNK